MKTIKLKKLSIRNFKGIKELTIEFNGKQSSIYGANEAGKTTIFDAFNWLLFGKDSFDRKDFGIKNSKHTELNRQEHEVEGVLSIDGEDIILKRIYKEKWTKPKGATRAEYSGNVQEFYWNEVPKSAGEFSKSINEIVDETVFKLITNPQYFNGLNWAKRREFLFKLAGGISDEDVVLEHPHFKDLVEIISKKSLEGYRAELSAKRKKLKEDLETIPTRIDELSRSLPEPLDFASIEQHIQKLDNQITEIDSQISDKVSANNSKLDSIRQKQSSVHRLKTKCQDIEFELQSAFKRKVNESGLARTSLLNKIEEIKRNINSKEILLKSHSDNMDALSLRKNNLKTLFETTNSQELEFKENEFACPSCLRAFEAEDIEAKKIELRANFIRQKNITLDEIDQKGVQLKKEIEERQSLITTVENSLVVLKDELRTAESDLERYDSENADKSEVIFNLAEEVSNHETYQSYLKEISELEKEIETENNAVSASVDTSELTNQKSTFRAEIDALKKDLNTRDQINSGNKRIAELKEQEVNLAQQLAEHEKSEDLINSFTKSKIEMVEGRINGKFQYVKFKMFDYTIDGNPVETCEALYNSVPYTDLNTAHKIWAGIDIINTLSDHFNVNAPIFLDNRESITHIPVTESQVISLIVSPEDKVLRVVA